MYINELCSICKYTKRILFVYYTDMLSSENDIRIMENSANGELLNISSKWPKVKKLSLIIKKENHYMIFSIKWDFQMDLVIDEKSTTVIKKRNFLVQ